MDIAIIGTGQVGGALARGLSRAGHALWIGAREPDAETVRALCAATGAAAAPPAEAAAGAEVAILAVPWGAVDAVAAEIGAQAGGIVIDCTNPLGLVDGALGLMLGFADSGGERVARLLPGARVVKTLNQVGAEIMETAPDLPHRPAMFMAGDDDAAKAAVAGLLADLGFEALDAGDLTLARLLEPLGMVWINQALARGKGRRWALAAVEAPAEAAERTR